MQKTSRAYSKAAFDFALEHQELDAWFSLCLKLKSLSHKAFTNPTLGSEKLWSVFEDLKPTQGQRNWLDLMIQHKHLRLLPEISRGFITHYHEYLNIVPVHVTTATPLESEAQETLSSKLKKQLNSEVVVDFSINPTLIGGVQFEIHGKLIDHSLALVLKQIHTE